jgi:N-acyl-D-amino-acid deacylase
MGDHLDVSARTVVDAGGLAVAPGLIDFHSHSDFTLLNYPDAVNSISQGVTTEVLGNCGFSPAPLSLDGDHAAAFVSSCTGIGPDLRWRWSTFAEYLHELELVKPPVNCLPLVGHNAIRSAVFGFEDRAPTTVELELMRALVTEAMEAGAWGMSSGLIYAPGTYAAVEELVSLGEIVAAFGGLYASHVRNEGAGLVEAVEEALEVGRRSGVTVEVSHLKATGIENRGLVNEAIAAIEQARAEGVSAYCDVYPYTAGSTFLAMLTPSWVQEGGFDELVRRLGSREIRDRVRWEMTNGLPGWNSIFIAAGSWDGVVISSVNNRSLSHYEGRSVTELAAAADQDPFEFTFDLLVEDNAATAMVVFLMDEDDVRTVLEYPWSVIGSDQLLVTGRERKTHPRAYGTYAKVLGPLVREERLFPLETAVHKMTGLPADILGLLDRGRLAVGLIADIVLFDPATVTDLADYASPNDLAQGVELVLVGGATAFESGTATTPGLGSVLRHQASKS